MNRSNNYNLHGMGKLLSMYGQAGGMTETEANAARKNIKDIDNKLAKEKDVARRAELKRAKQDAIVKYQKAKKTMKQLLLGASETAGLAAKALAAKTKSLTKQASSVSSDHARYRRSPAPSVSSDSSDSSRSTGSSMLGSSSVNTSDIAQSSQSSE